MTTVMAEEIHRYPRRLRWIIELLSAIAVGVSTFLVGREVLVYLWNTYEIDSYVLRRLPPLQRLVDSLTAANLQGGQQLTDLVPHLLVLAIVLLITLLLRSAFPTVRTSGRGMLIEFAGSWLPVRWEEIVTVKATESPAGQRYVLLVQTRKKALTGWHRFYSFIYRFGWRRGFLVTSSIQSFDTLVKTVLHESDRTSKLMDVPPVRLDERSTSPHFQFLLSPVGFFSRRTASEQQPVAAAPARAPAPAPAAPAVSEQGVMVASYPQRIKQLISAVTFIILALALLRYLGFWRRFIAYIWPHAPEFFQKVSYPPPESGMWLLGAAHLMLVLLAPVLIVVWTLLSDLRAKTDGLSLRYLNKWITIPWQHITRIDAANLSEHNHVLLLETTRNSLPIWHRVAGMLFDGRNIPGLIVTSAVSNFEPLLQRILLAVSRTQQEDPEEPLFNDNAPAWGIRLMLAPSSAIDRLVAETRDDEDSQVFDKQRIKDMLRIPALLALMPTLLLFATLFVDRALMPTPGRLFLVFAFFLWSLLEWPLAAAIAWSVENNPNIDAEQARPFYLYPLVQLPRLIPMGLAYVLTLLSVPVLPILLWIAAAGWSFLLTSGLWDELYGWHQTKLLLMGLIPTIFQLATLLAYINLT